MYIYQSIRVHVYIMNNGTISHFLSLENYRRGIDVLLLFVLVSEGWKLFNKAPWNIYTDVCNVIYIYTLRPISLLWVFIDQLDLCGFLWAGLWTTFATFLLLGRIQCLIFAPCFSTQDTLSLWACNGQSHAEDSPPLRNQWPICVINKANRGGKHINNLGWSKKKHKPNRNRQKNGKENILFGLRLCQCKL